MGDSSVGLKIAKNLKYEVERALLSAPDDLHILREASVAENEIGDPMRNRGDLGAAREAYEAGLAIVQSLTAQDPSNTNGSAICLFPIIR